MKPHYPEQGSFRAFDAREGLLPQGTDPSQATLLFVHAHPDDESAATGATMARYAALGARVDLLTLTRGERGEVIGSELAHLDVRNRPEHEDGTGLSDGSALARVREAELRQAVTALGVRRHCFASREEHPGFFRDSGMSWLLDGTAGADPQAAEDSLARAPLPVVAEAVAAAIRETRPEVLVTYDADGGYGHPDHRRAHEAVMAALDLLDPAEMPALVWGVEGDPDPEDLRVQAAVDGDVEAKRRAMAAHVTQIVLDDEHTFHMSNDVPQVLSGTETFRLLAERPGALEGEPARAPAGRVTTAITGTCLGLLTGFLGSMLHTQITYLDAVWIPWGVLLALVLVVAGTIWMIHHSQRIWGGMLVGLTAFMLVGLFMTLRSEAMLVYPTLQAPIGIAGIIWSLGILAASMLGMSIAKRWVLSR